MKSEPSTPNHNRPGLTRRNVLNRVLTAAMAIVGWRLSAALVTPEFREPGPSEYVPENDYPYFGGEPKPQ